MRSITVIKKAARILYAYIYVIYQNRAVTDFALSSVNLQHTFVYLVFKCVVNNNFNNSSHKKYGIFLYIIESAHAIQR